MRGSHVPDLLPHIPPSSSGLGALGLCGCHLLWSLSSLEFYFDAIKTLCLYIMFIYFKDLCQKSIFNKNLNNFHFSLLQLWPLPHAVNFSPEMGLRLVGSLKYFVYGCFVYMYI